MPRVRAVFSVEAGSVPVPAVQLRQGAGRHRNLGRGSPVRGPPEAQQYVHPPHPPSIDRVHCFLVRGGGFAALRCSYFWEAHGFCAGLCWLPRRRMVSVSLATAWLFLVPDRSDFRFVFTTLRDLPTLSAC